MDSIDLRELQVVVKQGLRNDVEDVLPLRRTQTDASRSITHSLDTVEFTQHPSKRGRGCGYRGEDETLGPGVAHLNLLQRSHYCLHLCRVASLQPAGNRRFVHTHTYGIKQCERVFS